ncbi:terminal uridylyltransferase Tailor-like isoform X2 [Vespa velutina]|uniref:terminal uridylyltransferase Tailor-like isoform X2 n=1 Tax=Vespa velutina TaxID=202808 RepID=UPI001FB55161|nr:terminal uridylyltransferase Tailor-like isoform X2 [Vespa velutina]
MAIKESEISNLDELIKNFKILCLVRKERNIDTISSQQSVASYSELKQEPANCKTNDDSNLYIPNDVYKEINAFLKWPMNDVLEEDKDIWDVREILKKTRVPIIKLRHRQTGLQCDLSFSNGLSVENTKLIKSINKACPQGRKLILFVKKWLSRCSLPGYHCITNYALAWLVIFYLQIEKFLPSIDTLIKRKNKSKLISGWETGVDHDIQDIVVNKSFDQLLREFFTFYGHFNYRDYVICPLIADTVEKIYFIDIFKLPKAMNLYIEYIQKSAINTSFRIDSSICLQDPFDLSHNLTKAVEPLTLRAFKKYCKLSANILNNMM